MTVSVCLIISFVRTLDTISPHTAAMAETVSLLFPESCRGPCSPSISTDIPLIESVASKWSRMKRAYNTGKFPTWNAPRAGSGSGIVAARSWKTPTLSSIMTEAVGGLGYSFACKVAVSTISAL
jgi:hypothetical protein